MTNASREDFNPLRYVCKYRYRIRVDKKAIKNLSSKRGAGTRDEALLTIPCPLLKRFDYCTLWAYLSNVVYHFL